MLILEKNENSIEIGVNTIFYVGGKKIKVVKSTYCDECFFHKRKECLYFSCTVGERKDKTNVVFLEQKE